MILNYTEIKKICINFSNYKLFKPIAIKRKINSFKTINKLKNIIRKTLLRNVLLNKKLKKYQNKIN
jgi:hypothetical protein